MLAAFPFPSIEPWTLLFHADPLPPLPATMSVSAVTSVTTCSFVFPVGGAGVGGVETKKMVDEAGLPDRVLADEKHERLCV